MKGSGGGQPQQVFEVMACVLSSSLTFEEKRDRTETGPENERRKTNLDMRDASFAHWQWAFTVRAP
ncbi:hypothetical protein GFK26_31775 [Variovorax paradoxus]|uniref:Uncharacterized protein n=1 Tax=Variovorax paradoxus TaxID=34073 RepID=A0A5Q0MD71_VARPD|nr:hypothetical protein [Variovorax paradoxus]QFZ87028.1 hypothetical protein GFK26_31775 [Variovorax paradoxus]